MPDALTAIAAAVIIVTVFILLPSRYIMVDPTDPAKIADVLRQRLSKDEMRALIAELIMGMD